MPLNILYDPALSAMVAATTCSYFNLKYLIFLMKKKITSSVGITTYQGHSSHSG